MITARDELLHALDGLAECEAEAALAAIAHVHHPRMSAVQIDQHIAAIARRELNFPTLETRRSDSLDFRDTAVWSVKAALLAAFNAGVASVAAPQCPLRNACPLCGEARIDELDLDEDDSCTCLTCGTTYDINGEAQ